MNTLYLKFHLDKVQGDVRRLNPNLSAPAIRVSLDDPEKAAEAVIDFAGKWNCDRICYAPHAPHAPHYIDIHALARFNKLVLR